MADLIGQAIPYPAFELAAKLERQIMDAIAEALSQRVDARIPPENTQFLVHGSKWSHEREGDNPAFGGFERQESHAEISTKDIVEGDISAINRFAAELIDRFESGFAANMYSTVGRAAEEVGNSISAKDMSFPDAFLEMLRRIEFGVDRKGQVTRPQIHLHPEMAKEVIPLMDAQGPEFQQEVDRLTAEKEAAALQREAERRARFKSRAQEGDDESPSSHRL